MKSKVVLLMLTMFGLAGGLGAQTDPFLGTWKINLAKTIFNVGTPPKSMVITFETSGDALKFTADIVDARGNQSQRRYTAKFDGKPYPFTSSNPATPPGETVTMKRLDAYSFERTTHLNGKLVQVAVEVVSKDGKTMTRTQKGPATDNVHFFEKQ